MASAKVESPVLSSTRLVAAIGYEPTKISSAEDSYIYIGVRVGWSAGFSLDNLILA